MVGSGSRCCLPRWASLILLMIDGYGDPVLGERLESLTDSFVEQLSQVFRQQVLHVRTSC